MQERPFGHDTLFGKVWRCTVCRKAESLRSGIIFGGSRINPFMILNIAYAYVGQNQNVSEIQSMVEGPPSKQTLVNWQEFFRDVMSKCVLQETTRKLGGPGKIVVVDETALGHRKYHRGQPKAV